MGSEVSRSMASLEEMVSFLRRERSVSQSGRQPAS